MIDVAYLFFFLSDQPLLGENIVFQTTLRLKLYRCCHLLFPPVPPSPSVKRGPISPSQPGFVNVEEYVHRLVKPSVDHVCRLRFPTGNYPPCIGDDRDLLVHWCHGSPGVVYMLLQAYRVHTERAN